LHGFLIRISCRLSIMSYQSFLSDKLLELK